MVAALYVDPLGIYSGLEDVELWGLPDRDAMLYDGQHTVVAHPRWCRLSGLVEARWGQPDRLRPGMTEGHEERSVPDA